METIRVCWHTLVSYYTAHPFLSGFWCGILIVVLLLFVLLPLLFRKKTVPGISYETKNGAVFIRTSAIEDLVRSLRNDFPELVFGKVVLARKKGKVIMQLNVDCRTDILSFQDTVLHLQERILEVLKASFGIESIEQIEISMCKTIPAGQKE